MKKAIICFLFSIIFIGCKSICSNKRPIKSITIDTLLNEKISIRAIVIDKDRVYYAGDKSRVGYIKFVKENNAINQAQVKDTIDIEYRSIAITNEGVFVLNVGNPALLSQFSRNLQQKKIVYQENHDKVFYDSMQFWNDKEGIAIGDPTQDCLSIIITTDGGRSWQKIPCSQLPGVVEGEAAFAASNTNVVVKGTHAWIVSGGKKARVFHSPNKGITWEVIETPIIQGETMTGIFTADFYNEKIGFIAGGNYEKPNQNFQNKALTIDGGKTWQLVGENIGFGYASCVQFIPDGNGNEIVSVGKTGVFYSNDKGTSWKQLSTDTTFYTIRFIDSRTAIAAGKNTICKLRFN